MYLNFLLFFNSDSCDLFKKSFLHYHKDIHYFLKSLLFCLHFKAYNLPGIHI